MSVRRFLEWVLQREIDVYDPHFQGKQRRLHPFLGQQLQDRKRYHQPTPKKEPYTVDMFVALHRLVLNAPDAHLCFLGKVYCVYDWARLGVFTGFRIGEYGQNEVSARAPYNRLPFENDVPAEFRGMPIAMMASDFCFYDKHFVLIPHCDLQSRARQGDVRWLEIRWRYDKSAHNFVKKKFQWIGHPIFCPVDAAVSIIRRSLLLGIAATQPIGAWGSGLGTYNFLHANHVSEVMRGSVVLAYDTPNHYMRRNVSRICPHSNRVTAAVCLQQGGADNDEIAFKLRWNPISVPTYLRDCFQEIGASLQTALVGALKLTFSSSGAATT